jgi:RNA polymerase sigma factor (sigma-70 family)
MNPTLTEAVTPEDLETARRDFRRMLRKKRLSPQWIEGHAEDLLAQAQVEYAAKLAKGEPARSVVGWLVNGAWWRAQDLLESEGRRPPTSSIEAAFHLADESEPGPEHLALRSDRAATLRRALSELPEKDRRLLALVYFDGESIRAAGRKIGWQKSAADRHHGEALKRLRLLLGDDRSLLSPAMLGPAAWIVLEAEGSATLVRAARLLGVPLQRTLAELAELGSGATQRVAGLWRRLSPLADPAAAAAGSGGGRALGACGVAAATLLCGVAASGVVAPAGIHMSAAKPKAKVSTAPAPPLYSPSARAGLPPSSSEASGEPTHEAATHKVRLAEPRPTQRAGSEAASTRRGKPTPVAQEFGVEPAPGSQRRAHATGEASTSSPGVSQAIGTGPGETTDSPASEPVESRKSGARAVGSASKSSPSDEFGL